MIIDPDDIDRLMIAEYDWKDVLIAFNLPYHVFLSD